MADSGITKKALASSLKELMVLQPYAKISIGEICDGCEMNRKSFYYHFRDKDDLVVWIFDTEYERYSRDTRQTDKLCVLVNYLFENRSFYKKIFKVEGTNSLADHFRRMISERVIDGTLFSEPLTDFQVGLLADFLLAAIKRWLFEGDGISPEDFQMQLADCARTLMNFVK